jgi:hypothetical protein
MSTMFRVPLAGWVAALVLIIAAIPQAESHSRKKGTSCTEGDPTCWVKPAVRSSCNFWDADCATRRPYHQRYEKYYNGYTHRQHHHHHHAPQVAPAGFYDDANDWRHQRKHGWNQRYWETRFYHRRFESYRRPHQPREYTWIERDYSYAGGLHCLPRHREVGDEMSSREKAIVNVERRWAHSMSYDRGGKYANLDRAKDAKLHCDPTGQSRWLKKALWTCVMVAVPCRAIEPDRLRDRKRFESDEITIEDERIDR